MALRSATVSMPIIEQSLTTAANGNGRNQIIVIMFPCIVEYVVPGAVTKIVKIPVSIAIFHCKILPLRLNQIDKLMYI